jgi:hypothetical protein
MGQRGIACTSFRVEDSFSSQFRSAAILGRFDHVSGDSLSHEFKDANRYDGRSRDHRRGGRRYAFDR